MTAISGNPATSAVAISPSGLLIYATTATTMYVSRIKALTLNMSTPEVPLFRRIDLDTSYSSGWTSIFVDTVGRRRAITVAPDDTTLFVNVDNTVLLVLETNGKDGILIARVTLPTVESPGPSATFNGGTELPIFAPQLLGWTERSRTNATAVASVVVAVGPVLHRYGLFYDNTVQFIATERPLPVASGYVSYATALASLPSGNGFVVCYKTTFQLGDYGANCFKSARSDGLATQIVTNLYSNAAAGAWVTAIDVCTPSSSGADDAGGDGGGDCVFLALRLSYTRTSLLNPNIVSNTDSTTGNSIIRLTASTTGVVVASQAAMVPGAPIIDLKITSGANMLMLLRASAGASGATQVAGLTVLARVAAGVYQAIGTPLQPVASDTLSQSSASAAMFTPQIVATADRESFLVAAGGKTSTWFSYLLTPVLNIATLTLPSSAQLKLSYYVWGTNTTNLFTTSTLLSLNDTTVEVSGNYRMASYVSTACTDITSNCNVTLSQNPGDVVGNFSDVMVDLPSPYTSQLSLSNKPRPGFSTAASVFTLPTVARALLREMLVPHIIAIADVVPTTEVSWFDTSMTGSNFGGSGVRNVIAAWYTNPVFGATTKLNIIFAPQLATNNINYFTLTIPHGAMSSSLVTFTALNTGWYANFSCLPVTSTNKKQVLCTRVWNSAAPVANQTYVFHAVFPVVLSSPSSLDTPTDGATAVLAMKDGLSDTVANKAVASAFYSHTPLYVPPNQIPAGYFGHTHRTRIALLPNSTVDLSWIARGKTLCYAFAANHRGCFHNEIFSSEIRGDLTAAAVSATAPLNSNSAAYSAHGTLVSIVTSADWTYAAIRFYTNANRAPQAVPETYQYADLPFDPALFHERLGYSNRSRIHVVQSAEAFGAIVIVHNDAFNVVMLARLSSHTLRASGRAQSLTAELMKRMMTPISFAPPASLGTGVPVSADSLVAVLDWTAPTMLSPAVEPSTRIVFIFKSGAVVMCTATIRNTVFADRYASDITVDSVNMACPPALALTVTASAADSTPLRPTSAVINRASGYIYIGTREGKVVVLALEVQSQKIVTTPNVVQTLQTACPVAAMALHPTGYLLTVACASSRELIPLRIVSSDDLYRYIYRDDQFVGSLTHVPLTPTRDHSALNTLPLNMSLAQASINSGITTYINGFPYYSRKTLFRSISGMAYMPNGAYLAVMGNLSTSAVSAQQAHIQFFRSVEEVPAQFSIVGSINMGATSDWRIKVEHFGTYNMFKPSGFAAGLSHYCAVTAPSTTVLPSNSAYIPLNSTLNGNVNSQLSTTFVSYTSSPLPTLRFFVDENNTIGSERLSWTLGLNSVKNPATEDLNKVQGPWLSCSAYVLQQDVSSPFWGASGYTPAWTGSATLLSSTDGAVSYDTFITKVYGMNTYMNSYWSMTPYINTPGMDDSVSTFGLAQTIPFVLLSDSKTAVAREFFIRVVARFPGETDESEPAPHCTLSGSNQGIVVVFALGDNMSTSFNFRCTVSSKANMPYVIEATPWVGGLTTGHAVGEPFLLWREITVTALFTLVTKTVSPLDGVTMDVNAEYYVAGVPVEIWLQSDSPWTQPSVEVMIDTEAAGGVCEIRALPQWGYVATPTTTAYVTVYSEQATVDPALNAVLVATMTCRDRIPDPGFVVSHTVLASGATGDLLPARPVKGGVFISALSMEYPFEIAVSLPPAPVEVTLLAVPKPTMSEVTVSLELLRNGLPLAVPCSLAAGPGQPGDGVVTAARQVTMSVYISEEVYPTTLLTCTGPVAPSDLVTLHIAFPNNTGDYVVISYTPISAWILSSIGIVPVQAPLASALRPDFLPVLTPVWVEVAPSVYQNEGVTTTLTFTTVPLVLVNGTVLYNELCAFASADYLDTVFRDARTAAGYNALLSAGVLVYSLRATFGLQQSAARMAVLMVCSDAAIASAEFAGLSSGFQNGNYITVSVSRAAGAYLYAPRLARHNESFSFFPMPRIGVTDTTRSAYALEPGSEPFSEPQTDVYLNEEGPAVLTLDWTFPPGRENPWVIFIYPREQWTCYFGDDANASTLEFVVPTTNGTDVGSFTFNFSCPALRQNETLTTTVYDGSSGEPFIMWWDTLKLRFRGRVTATASPPPHIAGDAVLNLSDPWSTVIFPLVTVMQVTFAFAPPLFVTTVFRLSFSNPTAECVIVETNLESHVFNVSQGADALAVLISCLYPAAIPPQILLEAEVAETGNFEPFASSALQTQGVMTLTILSLTTGAQVPLADYSEGLVAALTYTITGVFTPAPKVPQTVNLTQIMHPANCVFTLPGSALDKGVAAAEPLFVQVQPSNDFVALMVCRRAHSLGSLIALSSNAYEGGNIGPWPVYGRIGIDMLSPAAAAAQGLALTASAAMKDVTDLASRALLSLTPIPVAATPLPTPYFLRAPVANTTVFRLRMLPPVIVRTTVRMSMVSTAGACGFTSVDAGITTVSSSLQIPLVLGDISQTFLVSCNATTFESVRLLAEVITGSLHLPQLSAPLLVRGTVLFKTTPSSSPTSVVIAQPFQVRFISHTDHFYF